MDAKLLSQLNTIVVNAAAFGTTEKTRHVQLRYSDIMEFFQRGSMKLRSLFDERRLSETLTKLVKTDVLLRHIHRINVVTSRRCLYYRVSVCHAC